ncbi:hypothetical protein WJX75_004497 [Coccomyxa subellipsoidea]|uniref:Uncharacterized protein n=1 Tax=Coccomyxa subellipsoidea TaxID=248742 RepID=A0ABR2YPQ1_9CHLO
MSLYLLRHRTLETHFRGCRTFSNRAVDALLLKGDGAGHWESARLSEDPMIEESSATCGCDLSHSSNKHNLSNTPGNKTALLVADVMSKMSMHAQQEHSGQPRKSSNTAPAVLTPKQKPKVPSRQLRWRLLTAAVLSTFPDFHMKKTTNLSSQGDCNQRVLELHAQYAAELQAAKERATQERMAFLRANDVQAYLQLAQNAKNSRLNELLSSTDACLRHLTSRLRLASSVLVRGPRGANSADYEGDLTALKESTSQWNNLANSLRAEIHEQPRMLKGGQLRSYQLEGLRWMVSLHDHGLNGILADEMGLGKTIQIIALIAFLVETRGIAGPYLVVAPSSVIPNWDSEFQQWAPALKVVAFRGTAQERLRIATTQMRGSFNVVLTTYEALMGVDLPFLSKIRWHHLIVDEGHRLKNSDCKLNSVLKQYNTQHRLLLTGTPVQNCLDELWSLLHFLMPTLFTSSKDFQQWFGQDQPRGVPGEGSPFNEEEMLLVTNRLHQALRPFMLRRLKETVATELPGKVEHIISCSATPYQRFLCSLIEQDLKREPGKKQGVKGVNNSVMELRKICNHPFLSWLHPEGSEALLPPHPLPAALRLCGKLAVLDSLLIKLCTAGHKVLVFSTMTRLLDIVEDHLDWRGIEHLRLDGSTASADRGDLVRDFNDPASKCSVFLVSVRAGGVGVNLQAADTIIMYDTDWNPQIDLQAQARAHRIGQTKEVLVLRLQTAKSIEEHIYSVATQKRNIADRSITGGFFDGKTDAQERRAYLLDLLSNKSSQSHSDGTENLVYALRNGRATDATADEQLTMLAARGSTEAAIFAEHDRSMAERDEQAWKQTRPPSDGDGHTGRYSRLATEQESQALIESARIAAKPAEEPKWEDLGRGKRKRSAQGLADMGERAFKRLIRNGELSMPSGYANPRFAGMAGLASASSLSSVFDEVILLERDTLPAHIEALSAKRGGVPQFMQPHVMLVGGLRLCEELFGGFKANLQKAGGQDVDWLKDCSVWDFGGYMEPMPQDEPSPLESVGATRKLMEHTAREIVFTKENITVQSGALVSGLKFSEGGAAVSGVVLKDGDVISADFVVDASGRNSKLSEWLEASGHSAPPQEVINSGLGYGTRTYQIPEDWYQKHGWKAAIVSPRPNSGRQGLLLPIEDNRWQLIMTGLAGDHPPTDEKGYLEFARSLPQNHIYDAIRQAEPLGPVYTYSRTENVRRRYEEIDLPAGLCVLGDAAVSFNPVYGQGMTVGIKGAVLLRDMLKKRMGQDTTFSKEKRKDLLQGFGKEYQAALAALQDFPWTVATGDDEKHLQALGKLAPKKKTLGETFINWYFLQAVKCAMQDYKVRREIFTVNHMMVPPTALFSPSIASKVALMSIQDAWGTLTTG